MVKLSDEKRQLLKADISSILYENPLRPLFTNEIARELRRDKEFTKDLLLEMEKEGLVEQVKKDKRGNVFSLRKKWRIPARVLRVYGGREF